MARKKKRKARRQAKWHISGKKADLSRKRGHKPLVLLQLYHTKMEKNLDKLGNVIARRKAAGE